MFEYDRDGVSDADLEVHRQFRGRFDPAEMDHVVVDNSGSEAETVAGRMRSAELLDRKPEERADAAEDLPEPLAAFEGLGDEHHLRPGLLGALLEGTDSLDA